MARSNRLVLIEPKRVVVFEHKTPVATYDVIGEVDAQGIEEIRVADYRVRQLELELDPA